MNTKRAELINALITGLNIKEDIFAIETVRESTEYLNEAQYLDFYQAVMKEDSFGNGVKSVIKIAEQFKPIKEEDELELKAKKLIELTHSMNNAVYQDHIRTGRRFEDLLELVTFPELSEYDNAVLSNVAPHNNLKALIGNINTYTTTQTQLQAFINALKFAPSDAIQIANPIQNLRIKR